MSEQAATEQFREQLSALMDGELPRDELRFLLRRMDADAELTRSWSRFQLARSALRRQLGAPLRMDFADVLMQRIAHEAVPAAISPGPRRGALLLRWAGGGAIAAAVAVVALVTTRPAGEMQTPGALVATAAPTAIQDTHASLSVSAPAPAPALVNFDYAQPASFDAGPVAMPRYDLMRRRYDGNNVDAANAGVPYVLLTVPRSQQAPVPRQEKPQQ